MQSNTFTDIFLIAACALSTGARAQLTYKCGETYSQLPCTGAVLVEASDQRTRAQKMQSDLVTDRAVRTGDAMEKARRQQEKIDIAANTPSENPIRVNAANAPVTTQAKKKKKKTPEYFTAQVPGEKNNKKATKKSIPIKAGSKS